MVVRLAETANRRDREREFLPSPSDRGGRGGTLIAVNSVSSTNLSRNLIDECFGTKVKEPTLHVYYNLEDSHIHARPPQRSEKVHICIGATRRDWWQPPAAMLGLGSSDGPRRRVAPMHTCTFSERCGGRACMWLSSKLL